jgi:hypothetical protein
MTVQGLDHGQVGAPVRIFENPRKIADRLVIMNGKTKKYMAQCFNALPLI